MHIQAGTRIDRHINTTGLVGVIYPSCCGKGNDNQDILSQGSENDRIFVPAPNEEPFTSFH